MSATSIHPPSAFARDPLSRQRRRPYCTHVQSRLHDITGGDRGAVALFTGTATRPDGRTLHNPTALRIDTSDGEIVELWEFAWDLEHAEDFWA